MAIAIFLKFEGGSTKVVGEDGGGKTGVVKVNNWQFGASKFVNLNAAGGSASGQADVRDITFSKNQDTSTIPLARALFAGTVFDKVTVYVVDTTEGKETDVVSLELSKVALNGFQTGGGGGQDTIQEDFTVNFAKIKFSVQAMNEGKAKGGVSVITYDSPAGKLV